jgi:HAD superfamily hydrolase (TIGR01509 family)
MNNFELVIFDCDGVLVDSERTSQEVLAKVLHTECGLLLTLDNMYENFLGRSFGQFMHIVEAMIGKKPPADLEEKCSRAINAALKSSIKPVAGIHQAIAEISIPYCVASSGSYEKMHITLGETNLLPFFEGKLFSTSDVSRGKPYPDIYLHAANKLGVSDPSKCIVIEDSPLGVQGAKAAGMTVCGYSELTHKHQLIEAGAHLTIDNMEVLISETKLFVEGEKLKSL